MTLVSYKLILPEHLNHYGSLYGGNMMKWADEYAYIAARIDFPTSRFATIGLDKVEFKKGTTKGDILEFDIERKHIGTSSVSYFVNVRCVAEMEDSSPSASLFSTTVTFVCLDEYGKKKALPSV